MDLANDDGLSTCTIIAINMNSKCVILIDTSYFIFHRFYATYRWYTLQRDNCTTCGCELIQDIEFLAAYYKHLQTDIKKLMNQHNTSNVWFILDCKRSDIWRTQLFPDYKATRKHNEIFSNDIFPLTYAFIETSMLATYTSFKMMSHPCLEADDICFVCQKYIVATKMFEKVIIIANDNDYLQMVSENVEVINKEGKHIKDRGSGNANTDMMKKVLMGDKSDNIPSICRGVGAKTAEKLLTMSDEDMLQWMATKGDHVLRQYKLNMQLINMSHIPSNHVDCVVENLKII